MSKRTKKKKNYAQYSDTSYKVKKILWQILKEKKAIINYKQSGI